MTQRLELYDKGFKVAIVKKSLQQTIIKTHETNKSKEDLSKEVKDIKKNQLKVLEIKYTITKI